LGGGVRARLDEVRAGEFEHSALGVGVVVGRDYERAYRKAVEAILEGYTRGKHLVKITADGASIGPGVDPTIGMPLP
jgi:hypothetical protein